MIATAPRRHAACTVALLMTLAACSGAPATTSGPTASPSAVPSPTPAALVADVDVGGRTLRMVCLGPENTGRPTVVFEHGLGADLGQWRDALVGLEATDRACSYDRAGRGSSEPASGPSTTADQVEDLHALLEGAGVPPPYVLVGFSIGGWNVMAFTDRYPDEVAGAVLVDVRHPEASARWLAELPPEVEGEPDAIHLNRLEFTEFEADPSLNPEGLDIRTSSAEVAAFAGFGDRPLEVLSAGDTSAIWAGLEPDLVARLEAVTIELRGDLVAMSSRGHEIVIEDAPHEIPGERPDAVIEAVRTVLAAIAAAAG